MQNKSKLPTAIHAVVQEQLPKPAGRFARIILDRWFKRTFGEESRKRLLELLLKELIPEREIESLTYVRDEHINAFDDGHDGRIDVECTDKDGSRFMVEMQVRPQSSFYDRAVLYSALGIQQQVERGVDEYWLKPMYFIGLMDFSMHDGSDQVLWRYSIRNDQDNEELMTDHLHYIFLELPNCKNALTEKATILDNFCYALHNMENLPEKPEGLNEEIFKILFESAEIATFSPAERIKYTEDMTTERDIRNQLAYAKDKGKEEGIALGEAKGKSEAKAEAARAMLKEGLPMDIIVKCTGLSVEEINKL